LLRLGTRQHHIPLRLDTPDFIFASLHISFRIVIHPQTDKRQRDAESLERMHVLREPHDSDANHSDTLYKRGDGVRDWGCRAEDRKGDDILREMDRAIREKVVHDAVVSDLRMSSLRAGLVRPTCSQLRHIRRHPYRNHEQKREAGRVEQKVQLVQLVLRRMTGRIGRAGHDLLEKDIRRNEHDRGTKRA